MPGGAGAPLDRSDRPVRPERSDRSDRPAELSGLLLLDKPAGITSHDLVDRVRRVAGQRSVGHTGTLDPMATGLMGLLLGPATKLGPWLAGLDKLYLGQAALGLATDTDDATGREISRHQGPWPDGAAVEAALARLEGPTMQTPPAYSAIKVGGLSAHRAARAGRPLDLAPRAVTAYELRVVAWRPPLLDFTARVSTGYYVRALARDLGSGLGLGGGALSALRRLAVGGFGLSDAMAPPESRGDLAAALIGPRRALGHLPEIALEGDQAGRLASGALVPFDGPLGGPYRIIGPDGRLVAVAEISPAPEGRGLPRRPFLRPLRVFRAG